MPQRLLAAPCEAWTTEDLRAVVVEASGTGRARSYLMSLRSMLRGVVRVGLDLGYLDADQINMDSVKVPKSAGRTSPRQSVYDSLGEEDDEDDLNFRVDRHQLPGIDRINALAAALPPLYGVMVLLASYSGLRWGEIVALRFNDICLEERTIRVDRAALEVSGGKLYLRLPKNRRRRTTIYPALLADAIKDLCDQARQRAENGGTNLLFPSPKGKLLRRSNFGSRVLRPAQLAAGWRDGWTFHTLRHCAAVWMIYDQRYDLHDVADVLGHRDATVTQRIYVQAREGVAARLAAQAV